MKHIGYMLKKIFGKPQNILHGLNKACNLTFEAVYTRCRLDFGRECVELMDIKRRLVERCETKDGCTPVQNMITKKVLELITLYFKLADSIVSVKKGTVSEEPVLIYIESTKDRMNRIFSLISSLNNQFYMKADESNPIACCDDLINEAEALCNVIKNDYTRNTL